MRVVFIGKVQIHAAAFASSNLSQTAPLFLVVVNAVAAVGGFFVGTLGLRSRLASRSATGAGVKLSYVRE
jgi:hypothetical protein